MQNAVDVVVPPSFLFFLRPRLVVSVTGEVAINSSPAPTPAPAPHGGPGLPAHHPRKQP